MTQVLEALKVRYGRYEPEDWFTVGHRAAGVEKPTWAHFQVKDLVVATRMIEALPNSDVWSTMAVFSTQPGNGCKGTADEVSKCAWLYVDVDCHDDPDNLPIIRQRIKAFKYPPPTTIVFSGRGYHAYWAIKPTYDKEAVREHNQWLRYRLEGDSVQSVDRIMRVPGTPNILTNPRVMCESFDTDVIYTLDDFTAPDGYGEPIQSLIDFEFEPIPADFETNVRKLLGKRTHLWERIQDERGALKHGAPIKAPGVIDRSRNDSFIAIKLLEVGYAPGVVASVLSHPSWLSGRKFQEKGWDYIIRTIRDAHAKVASVPIPEIVVGKGDAMFMEGVAAESIVKYFNVQSFQGVPYRYHDGEWRMGTDDVVIPVLSIKLKEYLQVDQINKTITLVEMLSRSYPANEEDGKEWLSVENGLLNLHSRELIEHTSDKFTPNRVPVKYTKDIPAAKYDEVRSYVNSVVGDGDLAFYEHLGWCLTTDLKMVADPVAMVLYGPPRTGKSELLYVVQGLLGPQNGATIDLAHLAGEQDYYAYGLLGKTYNIVFDSNMNMRWKYPDKLKDLISGDPSSFRKIFGDSTSARSRAKFWLATNRLPQAIGADDALFRRLIILECNNIWRSDTPGHQNGIGEHLRTDPVFLSALLNLALDGLDRLRVQKKHTLTASMTAAINKTREANNSVEEWRVACTEAAPGHLVPIARSFKEYTEYCRDVGRPTCKKGEFMERMATMGNERPELLVTRTGMKWVPELKNNYDCWEGMKLTKTFIQDVKIGQNGTIHIKSEAKSYQEN